MARPRSIPDEHILACAKDAFFAEGLQVSTADIAKRAGISEGTIFARFGTKEDLFFAAMGLTQPSFLIELHSRVGRRDIEEELIELVHEMLAFFEHAVPCIMLVVSSGAREKLVSNPQAPPARAIRELSNYFAKEAELGRLRPHDPEIISRLLVGTAWHYAFCEHVRINDIHPMPRQIYVRGVVDMILRGIRAEET
jgi:AcrR family transcriptional regulator